MTTTPTRFLTQEDIANRALQHVGAAYVTTLADDSKNADEISRCFHKVRRAELRRNVWRFATRKAVLYPVSTTMKNYMPATWLVGTTYAAGALVFSGNTIWSSKVASNVGHTPGVNASVDSLGNALWEAYFGPIVIDAWDTDVSYFAGDVVYESSVIYRSLTNDNSDEPAAATGTWLILGGTTTAYSVLYPIGAGPTQQTFTRNVFVLPYGYLKEAPQDPKAGSLSYLGAPSGRQYDDWTFENGFFTSSDVRPITFRFVADTWDIANMDDMFCEGWAARIATEICEALTQSTDKLKLLIGIYGKVMSEARLVNGIETGPTEPPEDDYLVCRG